MTKDMINTPIQSL